MASDVGVYDAMVGLLLHTGRGGTCFQFKTQARAQQAAGAHMQAPEGVPQGEYDVYVADAECWCGRCSEYRCTDASAGDGTGRCWCGHCSLLTPGIRAPAAGWGASERFRGHAALALLRAALSDAYMCTHSGERDALGGATGSAAGVDVGALPMNALRWFVGIHRPSSSGCWCGRCDDTCTANAVTLKPAAVVGTHVDPAAYIEWVDFHREEDCVYEDTPRAWDVLAAVAADDAPTLAALQAGLTPQELEDVVGESVACVLGCPEVSGAEFGTRLLTWACTTPYVETGVSRFYDGIDGVEGLLTLAISYAAYGLHPNLFSALLCRFSDADLAYLSGRLGDWLPGTASPVYAGLLHARLENTCYPLRARFWATATTNGAPR
jgi:hypothetical protein